MKQSTVATWLTGALLLGVGVGAFVAPPQQLAQSAAAAETHYFSGNLFPGAQGSSGLVPRVSGGRANFFTEHHTAIIKSEKKGGALIQETSAKGQAAIMTHTATANALTLCRWSPIYPSNNWGELYGQCHYYH